MVKNNVLEIKNISKSFKANKTLNNISLNIPKGQIFGLIGVNGIGKTTLIKIMLDLLRADKGSIKLFGTDSTKKNSRVNLAYLPEKFQPSIYLKGNEFLKLSVGYFNKKYDKKKAISLAKDLDLKVESLEDRVNKYSKGMGQKLGLISILLSEAPLLILDEPMSGLDPHVRIKLKDLLKNYAKKGNTIFFSSHILSDMEEICDHIGVIHKGNLEFEGTPKQFKTKHKAESLERAFLSVISN
jgi:ABC-2 type transport system ATP-binding protein